MPPGRNGPPEKTFMAVGTSLWVVGCGAALSACVLIVPAPAGTLTTTCSLTEGESTPCGLCVGASCQDALDECCQAGSSCEPAIANLVSCKSYETCGPSGTSLEERALRTCAARACADECTL